MSNEEIREWILAPDSKYIIETQEEYDLINKRIEQLWDIVEDPNNLDDPIASELNKLSQAAIIWEENEEYDWVDEWINERSIKISKS